MIHDIKNYSLRQSFLGGELALLSWESFERLLSAANVFLMLKFLNLYEFGVYQLVLAFYSIVASFLLDSIHEVVSNDLSRFLKEKNFDLFKRLFTEYGFFRIGFGLIAAVVIFFFSGFFSHLYGNTAEAYIKIISLLFVVESVRKVFISIFKANLHFNFLGSQSVIIALTKFILFAIFLKLGIFSIFWILVAHVSGYLVSALIMGIRFLMIFSDWVVSEISFKTSIFWEIIKRHGKWAVAGEQASRINQNIRPWLIRFFISTEAVAVFSLTFGLVSMLTSLVPAKTFSGIIPRELQDSKRLKFIYASGVKFIGFLGLGLALAALFIFPPILNLVLPKYNEVLPYFKVLIFILLPTAGFTILTRAILVAMREQKALFIRPLFQIASIAVFSALLMPRFGVWGAMAEYAITNLLLGWLFYVFLVKVRPELKIKTAELFRFSREDYLFVKENFIFVIKGLIAKLKFIR